MKDLTASHLHRLLAGATGLSPVRLEVTLREAGARPDWSRRARADLLRIAAGEEAARVASEITFRGRRFLSDERACLIRDYLTLFVDRIVERWRERRPRVLEVGCGAGAVITSLALEMEGEFWGSDISQPAVELAAENARALGAAVEFRQADLLAGLPADFDVVFANIPYEPAAARLPEEGWEPTVALYDPTGEDLGLIRRLLRQLPESLGALYMELPEDAPRQSLFVGHGLHLPDGELVGIEMTLPQARQSLSRIEAGFTARERRTP